MESNKGKSKCPNCKNPITKDDLIPIYTKEESKSNSKRFNIPKRPRPERNESNDNNANNSGFSFSSSFAFFPFMPFGFSYNNYGTDNNQEQPNTMYRELPEETKKALQCLFVIFIILFINNMFTTSSSYSAFYVY